MRSCIQYFHSPHLALPSTLDVQPRCIPNLMWGLQLSALRHQDIRPPLPYLQGTFVRRRLSTKGGSNRNISSLLVFSLSRYVPLPHLHPPSYSGSPRPAIPLRSAVPSFKTGSCLRFQDGQDALSYHVRLHSPRHALNRRHEGPPPAAPR